MNEIKEYQPHLMRIDSDGMGVSVSYKTYLDFKGQKAYLNDGLPMTKAFRVHLIMNLADEHEPDFVPILAVNPNFETDIDAFTGVDGLGQSLKQMLNQMQYSALFAPIVEQDVIEENV